MMMSNIWNWKRISLSRTFALLECTIILARILQEEGNSVWNAGKDERYRRCDFLTITFTLFTYNMHVKGSCEIKVKLIDIFCGS